MCEEITTTTIYPSRMTCYHSNELSKVNTVYGLSYEVGHEGQSRLVSVYSVYSVSLLVLFVGFASNVGLDIS
jgi:hypothetical protein